MSHADWYATNPDVLGDAGARAEIERALLGPGALDRELVPVIEAEVEHGPERSFVFASDGAARLETRAGAFAAGRFSTPTLAELSKGVAESGREVGRARLSILRGTHALTDIGALQASAPEGVLFQVASQFNCLEAPSASIVPVRDYLFDYTQGPRASISALPGTLLRHYRALAPDGSRFVQRDEACVNLLADVFDGAVAEVVSGYLETTRIHDVEGLARLLTERFDLLRVGVHDEVEVLFGHDWDGPVPNAPKRIAQALTSTIALGGYSRDDRSPALRAARMQLLKGAYLGTLLSTIALGKHTVVLTLIGGGVFGNPLGDIWEAILWAFGEIEPLPKADLHVVVNARTSSSRAEHEAAIARGGFVAEITPDEARFFGRR